METVTYPERVAAEVRVSMARAGVNATELSEATGISQATLSRKLRGYTPFDTRDLSLIGEALKVEPETFLPPLLAVA